MWAEDGFMFIAPHLICLTSSLLLSEGWKAEKSTTQKSNSQLVMADGCLLHWCSWYATVSLIEQYTSLSGRLGVRIIYITYNNEPSSTVFHFPLPPPPPPCFLSFLFGVGSCLRVMLRRAEPSSRVLVSGIWLCFWALMCDRFGEEINAGER